MVYSNFIMLFPNKQCSWDMIPAALLKEIFFNVFSPIILPVVNFHSCYAHVLVYVLLMTPTLEASYLSNYHPLSTLIFWLAWEGFIWQALKSVTCLLIPVPHQSALLQKPFQCNFCSFATTLWCFGMTFHRLVLNSKTDLLPVYAKSAVQVGLLLVIRVDQLSLHIWFQWVFSRDYSNHLLICKFSYIWQNYFAYKSIDALCITILLYEDL